MAMVFSAAKEIIFSTHILKCSNYIDLPPHFYYLINIDAIHISGIG